MTRGVALSNTAARAVTGVAVLAAATAALLRAGRAVSGAGRAAAVGGRAGAAGRCGCSLAVAAPGAGRGLAVAATAAAGLAVTPRVEGAALALGDALLTAVPGLAEPGTFGRALARDDAAGPGTIRALATGSACAAAAWARAPSCSFGMNGRDLVEAGAAAPCCIGTLAAAAVLTTATPAAADGRLAVPVSDVRLLTCSE